MNKSVNSSNHTPGPWYAERENSHAGDVATCHWDGGEWWSVFSLRWGEGGSAEANARLIAAAPDLLEALDTLTTVVGLTAFKYEAQRAVLQEACDKGRAAINKAKGGGL